MREQEKRLRLVSEQSNAAYDEAYERYLAGAAHLVAQGLKPGDTCPVCGNPFEHHFAAAEAEQIGREELQALQQRQESGRAALEQCRRSLAVQDEQERAQKEQLAALSAEIGECGAVREELEQARTQAKQAQTAAEQLKAARQRRSQLEQAQQDAQEAFRRAAVSEQEQRETLVGIKARLDAMRESFKCELQPAALEAELQKVAEEMAKRKTRIAEAQRQREFAQRELAAAEALLGSAREEERKAVEKCRAAEQAREDAFAAQGFVNAEQFSAARLEQAEAVALLERIVAHEKKVQAVQGERETLLRTLRGKQRPDMAAVEQAYRQAEEEANTLREQLAAQRQQLSSLEALKEEAKKSGRAPAAKSAGGGYAAKLCRHAARQSRRGHRQVCDGHPALRRHPGGKCAAGIRTWRALPLVAHPGGCGRQAQSWAQF